MALADFMFGPQLGALQQFQQRFRQNGQMPVLNQGGGPGQLAPQPNYGMPVAGAFGGGFSGFTPPKHSYELNAYAPDADPNNPYRPEFHPLAGSGLGSPQVPVQQAPLQQRQIAPRDFDPVAIDQTLVKQPRVRKQGF